MTCTKLKDIFLPENKDKKYSSRFALELIRDHIPECKDCYKWYMEQLKNGEFNPYAKDKDERMD